MLVLVALAHLRYLPVSLKLNSCLFLAVAVAVMMVAVVAVVAVFYIIKIGM
jgi:hypothetical protein